MTIATWLEVLSLYATSLFSSACCCSIVSVPVKSFTSLGGFGFLGTTFSIWANADKPTKTNSIIERNLFITVTCRKQYRPAIHFCLLTCRKENVDVAPLPLRLCFGSILMHNLLY